MRAAEWRDVRLRFLLRKRPTTEQLDRLRVAELVSFLPMEAIGEDGTIDTHAVRTREDVEQGYTLLFDGDVVVAKITPCFENGKGAFVAGLLGGVGYGTTELHVLRPGTDVDSRYLYYLTVSQPFRVHGEASMKGAAGQKRVPDEFVQDFRLRLPPLPIQRGIAKYLDAETARIDALASEKERMLALLMDKWAAFVSQTVIQGFEPNTLLRQSGLEWLGEIPLHWVTMRAKQLFEVRDERSSTGEEELLSVSHITGVTPRSEKTVFMFMAEDLEGYKRCQPGDLVINTLWAWMGAMGVAWQHGIVSPDYHVYRPLGPIRPAYVDALCRSAPFVAEVTSRSKGVWSSRLRLYPEAFLDIRFPVPPLEEQDEITRQIAAVRARDEKVRAALAASIDLLKERRKALITAAVTGELPLEAMAR